MALRREAKYEKAAMKPEEAIAQAGEGKLQPIYLVLGEEAFLRRQVIDAIRSGVDVGAAAAFNEDRWVATDTTASAVVGAAQTAPMMAPQRYLLLTGVEKWDRKGDTNLDDLATYASDPAPFSVLVVAAPKVNGSRKLVKLAKKSGFLVTCDALSRRELPGWVSRRAKAMGHPLERGLADAIAELAGPDLSTVVDALERLSLYVGEGKPIDEAALVAVVTRVRQETVWALVDALAVRDLGKALAALGDVYSRDEGPRLLGAIAWRVRQLLKFESALRAGRSGKDAAKAAGVAPFKARELERTVRRLPAGVLERWLLLLAEADLALKGSKRAGSEVIASMLVDMCRAA
jgi:DNA polymerase-3 subunit delta